MSVPIAAKGVKIYLYPTPKTFIKIQKEAYSIRTSNFRDFKPYTFHLSLRKKYIIFLKGGYFFKGQFPLEKWRYPPKK